FQAEDGIRVFHVTGVQTCALPISIPKLNQDAAGYASNVDHLVTPRGGQRSDDSAVLLLHEELEHVRLELRRDNDLGKDLIDGLRSEERRVGQGRRSRATPRPLDTK